MQTANQPTTPPAARSDARLIRGRRTLTLKLSNVHSLFNYLDVPYRRVRGETFWEANRAILPELWEALRDAARDRFRELHPDSAGGNGKDFHEFRTAYERTRDAFSWHLTPQQKAAADSDVVFLPRAAGNARARGIQRHSQATLVIALLRSGASYAQIQRELGTSCARSKAIRRHIKGPIFCGCGREGQHMGSCWFRLRPSPKWQAVVEARRGRPRSEEVRRKIGAGNRRPKKRGWTRSEQDRQRKSVAAKLRWATSEHRAPMVEHICKRAACGRRFMEKRSRGARSYCSRACNNKDRKRQ